MKVSSDLSPPSDSGENTDEISQEDEVSLAGSKFGESKRIQPHGHYGRFQFLKSVIPMVDEKYFSTGK